MMYFLPELVEIQQEVVEEEAEEGEDQEFI